MVESSFQAGVVTCRGEAAVHMPAPYTVSARLSSYLSDATLVSGYGVVPSSWLATGGEWLQHLEGDQALGPLRMSRIGPNRLRARSTELLQN